MERRLIEWTLAKDGHPPPHKKYLVQREGIPALCTPCYGMHSPWWVEKTLTGKELEPLQIQPTDLWTPWEKK